MARGRKQKWYCSECKTEFYVQSIRPKLCCACGSEKIGRTPSDELSKNFEEMEKRFFSVCKELNDAYGSFMRLKAEYDCIVDYWKQQKLRGYLTEEEYREKVMQFEGAKQRRRKK